MKYISIKVVILSTIGDQDRDIYNHMSHLLYVYNKTFVSFWIFNLFSICYVFTAISIYLIIMYLTIGNNFNYKFLKLNES